MALDALEGAAYHEAGHAVIAYLLGRRIRWVRIGEDLSGHTCAPPNDGGDGDPADELLIASAGAVAQGIFDPAGETIRDPVGTSAGSLLGGDIAHIDKQLDRLAGENERKRDRLVAKADQQAAGQLARPEVWAAVQVVAAELRKRRHLSGDAVEGLIAAHVPAALGWLAQP